VDYERALGRVNEYVGWRERTILIQKNTPQGGYSCQRCREELTTNCKEELPLIEKIANAIDPKLARLLRVPDRRPRSPTEDLELVGSERSAGPAGELRSKEVRSAATGTLSGFVAFQGRDFMIKLNPEIRLGPLRREQQSALLPGRTHWTWGRNHTPGA
jgi:hypothetical protein